MSRRGQRSAGDEASSRSPESLPDTVGSPARSPEDVMIYVRTCVLAASRLLFGAAGSRRGISRDSARFNSGGHVGVQPEDQWNDRRECPRD